MALDPVSGLWLPDSVAPRRRPVGGMSVGRSGQHKSVRIDNMSFWAEDGQICWEDTLTGRSDSMFPDVALERVRSMAKDLLGTTLETSICTDNQDKARLMEALRCLETLARGELARQPDRAKMEGLL